MNYNAAGLKNQEQGQSPAHYFVNDDYSGL